jgi:hypothetical protein
MKEQHEKGKIVKNRQKEKTWKKIMEEKMKPIKIWKRNK